MKDIKTVAARKQISGRTLERQWSRGHGVINWPVKPGSADFELSCRQSNQSTPERMALKTPQQLAICRPGAAAAGRVPRQTASAQGLGSALR
ncbi:hypothetical protein [Mesorhizobium sp. ES1-4]|uniref:hypothetical protein n=1 Tax=Mesorhizobium sp. ES1-4 TaxID=2876627 RepID=UPI001CCBA95F|nr:hypothetical protein [Mesorhizobium sp. ES1-4]MBZ9799266.1 hypothetical protein [Mesorhizobium sp. ES1-4]